MLKFNQIKWGYAHNSKPHDRILSALFYRPKEDNYIHIIYRPDTGGIDEHVWWYPHVISARGRFTTDVFTFATLCVSWEQVFDKPDAFADTDNITWWEEVKRYMIFPEEDKQELIDQYGDD